MKGKRLLYMSLIVMSILSVLSVLSVTPLTGEPYTPPSPGTWIHVEPDPSHHYSDVANLTGTRFNVSVNIFNVTDLAGWEWKLWYNTTLLDAIRVYKTWLTEDNTDWVPWYPTPGAFDPTIGINDTLPSTTFGRVWYSAVIPFMSPFTGSGPFLTIEFEIAMSPPRGYAPPANLSVSCPLHLNETALYKVIFEPPYSEPIDHSVDDGFYEYERGQEEVEGGDVAVINVVPIIERVIDPITLSQAYHVWGEPYYHTYVNVTVKNNATGTISFNVTAYYSASTWHEIGTQTVTDLAEGASTNRTFNWDLSVLTPGTNYTVKANATIIDLPDINPNNNEKVDGQVKVRIWGDLDGTDEVDIGDVKKVKLVYSGAQVNPFADVSGDGAVDIGDVKKVKLIYSGAL